MSAIFIFSIGLSIILFKARNYNRSSLFLSLFYFLCAIDIFLKIIRDFLIYYGHIDVVIGTFDLREKILILIYIVNTLTYILTPIFYFGFTAIYTDFIETKYTKLVSIAVASISLVYIIVIEIQFPVGYYSFHLRESARMLPFHLWNTALIVLSGVMATLSYYKEIRPSMKKEKRIIMIAFILPVSVFMFARYLFTYLRIEDTFSTVSIAIAVSFLLIFYFTFKYGLLGLRFNFEYYTSYSFNKELTSGASLFNHSFKNDILKISLHVQNIKNHSGTHTEILKSVAFMEALVNRMESCMIKINDTLNKASPNLMDYDVFSRVEEVIEEVKAFAFDKEIEFINECDKDLKIYCDRESISRSLENILINSIEAIKSKGSILIYTKIYPKYVAIIIRDDGVGIPAEKLKQVLNPYFTTKNSKNNFGLGLYYCNKTMESYHGSLDIETVEGKGTSVFLYFPRTVVSQKHLSRGAKLNG